MKSSFLLILNTHKKSLNEDNFLKSNVEDEHQNND